MKNELFKPDIVGRVSQKLIDEKITIGGNRDKYKRKYNLKYTHKIIQNVIDAFWEAVAEAIEEGDSVKLNNYVKMESRYFKAIKLNAKWLKEDVMPARYRVKFTMGKCLKDACKALTQRQQEDSG